MFSLNTVYDFQQGLVEIVFHLAFLSLLLELCCALEIKQVESFSETQIFSSTQRCCD